MFYKAEIAYQYQYRDCFSSNERLRYGRHPVIWERKFKKHRPFLGETNKK